MRLKLKIHILFCGDKSWTFVHSSVKFCVVKDTGHRTYLQVTFESSIDEAFKLNDPANFYVILGQTLNQCVQNSVILSNVVSFSLLFLKNEGEDYEVTILCMSVCPPL
jgi:hypothetical protein